MVGLISAREQRKFSAQSLGSGSAARARCGGLTESPAFLAQWGPEVAPEAGDARLPDFEAQCGALLAARPRAVSSIMGLFAPEFVTALKARGIASSRGRTARRGIVCPGPPIADMLSVPVIAAALTLGASAVQMGTAFLRRLEAQINPAWAEALVGLEPEDTVLTPAFSGRLGRSVNNAYVRAAAAGGAPPPAPYPAQRGLTEALPEDAQRTNDQSAAMARAEPAGDIVRRIWREAGALLP
jgi:nitronate monooxygenase